HDRVGCSCGDDVGDPRRPVRGDELQIPSPVAELVEELPDGLFRPAPSGPHDPAGDVVTHDGQVAVALLYLTSSIATATNPSRRSTHPRASRATRTHMLLTARHDTP